MMSAVTDLKPLVIIVTNEYQAKKLTEIFKDTGAYQVQVVELAEA
ncbi:hypothetical protein [Vibrio sp. S11_S32]|nr:hypothetical protein [Vibrio sp. S11_S32]